jgi:hypothetical protein
MVAVILTTTPFNDTLIFQ